MCLYSGCICVYVHGICVYVSICIVFVHGMFMMCVWCLHHTCVDGVWMMYMVFVFV